ncbi:MAG TPA: hypothetical protein VF897_07535, partial [Roseiflexaceae bacterium]
QPAPPPPADQPSPPPADQPAPPATAAPAPSPTAEPTPSPTAEPTAKPAEVVVDERAKGFKGEAKVKWYDGPDGCGEQGHALWTYTATGDDDSENVGRWQPKLDAEAMYDVYVGIPGCAGRKPNTAGARYRVHHRDGDKEIVVDQAASAGQWVLLGRFPFRKGDDGFVELRDRTGEDMLTIWFDAVRWVPAKD